MAKLSHDDVLKLARLSRLHLKDEELARFTKEIEAILGYVEQLQTVDLKDVAPTSQVTGLKNVTRPDTVQDYGVSTKALLRNAPAIAGAHIKVKRMLE